MLQKRNKHKKKNRPEPAKKEVESKKPVASEEEDVKWSVDTSPSAVEARRRELLGARDRLSQRENEQSDTKPKEKIVIPAGENPIPILHEYFKSGPDLSTCAEEIKELGEKHKWTESTLIKYIFASLFFTADLKTNFYKKTDVLSLVITTPQHQKVLLLCIERYLEDNRQLVDKMPHFLNGFFEECLIDEQTLKKWYLNPMKKGDLKFSKEMREKSRPFIDWLNTAAVEQSESKESAVTI